MDPRPTSSKNQQPSVTLRIQTQMTATYHATPPKAPPPGAAVFVPQTGYGHGNSFFVRRYLREAQKRPHPEKTRNGLSIELDAEHPSRLGSS